MLAMPALGRRAVFPLTRGVARRCLKTPADYIQQSDDAEFSARFKKLPDAYTNFDVKDTVFGIVDGSRPAPGMHRNDSSKLDRGHRHLVPWSCVRFANMSYKGNLGRMQYEGAILSDPNRAYMDIILSDEGLSGVGVNNDFVEYTTYVQELFDRFVDYLVDNAHRVPALDDIVELSRADRLEELKGYSVPPVKEADNGQLMIKFNKKIYRPHRGQSLTEFDCDYDKEIYLDHALARNNVPVFDPAGNIVPLEQQGIYVNDVVGLQVTIKPAVWKTDFGEVKVAFLKNLNAVVLRELGQPLEEEEKVITNPFGG